MTIILHCFWVQICRCIVKRGTLCPNSSALSTLYSPLTLHMQYGATAQSLHGMFRIKLSPLWYPSLRYDARIPSYSASHTLCTWNIFFLPSNLSTWANCETNNNQVVECSRSTRRAGGDRLYSISVVPMVCVLISSIKRVCAWLISEYWLWGQELLYQLQADLWRTEVYSFYLMQCNTLPGGLVPL